MPISYSLGKQFREAQFAASEQNKITVQVVMDGINDGMVESQCLFNGDIEELSCAISFLLANICSTHNEDSDEIIDKIKVATKMIMSSSSYLPHGGEE